MNARGGIDIEALSPRDANALPKRTTDLKAKAAAQLKSSKDKDHPPMPPPLVTEPPSSDRKDGAVYQVGRLLGKGGFAICYDGKHADTGKRYALKIVKSQMPVKMQQKFQTELQIHSKMRHRNIVQFHRAFTFESCTYLALELCPNGSLMEMVKKRKGLTEAEVRFYTVQIAGAIKYMHDKGIIHRDLKMGNIFLDKYMNAKVGDFGLAALLVTGNDMHTIRRTTLCGTPNYIAPEILQKGKSGHDHMVDIWSLGIIIFAMLTTKPPFQSSTTDEIYRRAREREYDWPENDQRIISPEAKMIVSSMLVDADKRPDPDLIVQHPFFAAGYVPVQADISMKLRETPPQQEIFYDACEQPKLRERTMRNLRALCQECDVGPWHQSTRPPATAIWREIAAEEKHGLTPNIPLAADVVYRPYDEIRKEKKQLAVSQSVSMLCEKTEALTIDSSSATKIQSGLLRAPPQSFAAQQRAANRPKNVLPTSQTLPSMSTAPTRPGTVRGRAVKKELPLTTSGALSVEGHEKATRGPTRTTRTQLPSGKAQPTARSASDSQPISKTEAPKETVGTGPEGQKLTTLFAPDEPQELLNDTRPDVVLGKMRKLQSELERALKARSQAYLSAQDKEPDVPKVVVKWVDYSNKFGVGYILNDGSAGCILNHVVAPLGNEDAVLPPTYLLVHGTEKHISRRHDPTYSDRHQIVPMTNNIYFYELHGEEGVSRTAVHPEEFRVSVNPDGTSSKLGPGNDLWKHRKRERIVLWKKFANYMLQYARDPKDIDMFAPTTGEPGDLVTFYQRFGDVGVWYFCDGHIQFNFPDHTKIVLDSTGKWCHFWHLSEEAAQRLAQTGELDESSLDNRAVLSYPLQTLLNFTMSNTTSAAASQSGRYRPEIPKGLLFVPDANGFRDKVKFMHKIVKEWVQNGGIGQSDMSREGRLKWDGVRQTMQVEPVTKHVWVTVGARGSDSRHAVWVDCRKPTVLLENIDENRKSDDTRKG
ncbi:kinase-like protein [Cryphonectria parasitica EP155]|uniref:Kinase-like protein n=1 Tax=Cryphonectria parasitica (strain ATCC 38755 / EP155) TaxID=660469 RepID=A0A9P4Y9R4_CRYP1|nr:kinase-like protein [Cryphonectria parasitica EP155]KAF3769091.1 kinase-like protein [Cryphonectria parasitica EP155]